MIRKATPDDDYRITRMLQDMREESPSILPEVDCELVGQVIANCIEDGVCYVIQGDGFDGITGVLMGAITWDSYWWNSEYRFAVLKDFAFYIKPDYRTYRNAKRLVEAFVQAGKEKGAEIQLGHMHSKQANRLDKLYIKLGGRKIGSLFDFTHK